jgi:hypothetical protein
LEFEQVEDKMSTISACVLNDADLLSIKSSATSTEKIFCVLSSVSSGVTRHSDGICPIPELYVKNHKFAKALSWLLPKTPSANIRFNVYTTMPFEIADVIGLEQPTIHQNTTESSGPVDLSSIAKFYHLRHFSICGASLCGSYSYTFDFPNLTPLEFVDVGEPNLEWLTAVQNTHLTGKFDTGENMFDNLLQTRWRFDGSQGLSLVE